MIVPSVPACVCQNMNRFDQSSFPHAESPFPNPLYLLRLMSQTSVTHPVPFNIFLLHVIHLCLKKKKTEAGTNGGGGGEEKILRMRSGKTAARKVNGTAV